MRFIFLLAISLSVLATQTADASFPRLKVIREVRHLRANLLAEGTPQQTDKAIRAMVNLAVRLLLKKGLSDEASALKTDFYGRWDGYFQRWALLDDIGDHKPYSEWLALTYDMLKLTLGEKVLKFWHLDDINTVNYAITVVFDPKNHEWDKKEYGLHFVPFSGVLAYWTIWIGCEIYTATAGAYFPCSPAGTLGRLIMVNLFAPYISNSVYDHSNRP